MPSIEYRIMRNGECIWRFYTAREAKEYASKYPNVTIEEKG